MVDPGRVRALLARLSQRRERLERYALRSLPEFLADEEGLAACKYLLLTAIEDVIAMANHVIASEGYRSPADYGDAFRILVEQRVLEPGLGVRLAAMARFRNLLVHVYAEVDESRLHDILQNDLADCDAFSAAILCAFPDLA